MPHSADNNPAMACPPIPIIILVVEQGNIVEDGGHDDLIRQQGHYARLHALQVGAG